MATSVTVKDVTVKEALPPTCCRLCAALTATRDDPAVARILDRLVDEMTVVLCRDTGLGDVPEQRVRGDDRRRMIRALSFGPLLLRELVLEVYPLSTPDPDETALRHHRVKTILHRLVTVGVLVRVRRGVFALAAGRRTVRPAATMNDCWRILADPHVNPSGLTTREIADRLDIPLPTIQKWLERLRDRNAGLVAASEPNPVGGRRFRYRIGEVA